MNITFLIGNGFDLNCGLKTSYKDVYKQYCLSHSESELIKEFKKNISRNYETWSDFEIGMSKYLRNFKSEDDFLTCLRDFKVFLNDYLSKEENKFITACSNKNFMQMLRKEFLDSINYFFEGITHDITNNISRMLNNKSGNSYNFITFNYTNTLELIRNATVSSYHLNKIIHIHGSLNDDLILGMDNIKQIDENQLKFKLSNRGRRAFLKTELNQYYDSERVDNATSTILNSDIICVYGMSLGISDISWRNLLIGWALADEKHKLFIFNYENSKIISRTVDERIDNEEIAKSAYFNEINLPLDKQEILFSRIYMPCGRNIFNIKEYFDDLMNQNKKNNEQLPKAANT